MSDNDSRGDDSQDEGDFEDRQEDEELEEVAQNKSTHQKRGKPDSSKKGKPAPKKKRRTQKGVKKFIDTHAEVASSSESEEEPDEWARMSQKEREKMNSIMATKRHGLTEDLINRMQSRYKDVEEDDKLDDEGDVEGDLEELSETINQQRRHKKSRESDMQLLPTAKDKLFIVQCEAGHEREACISIYRKCLRNTKDGSKIFSVVAKDGLSGKLYIEAENQSFVTNICRGLSIIKSWSVKLVPIKDMPDVMSVGRRVQTEVQVGHTVRIKKRGTYFNDLGLVVQVDSATQEAEREDSDDDELDKKRLSEPLLVRLLPRVNPPGTPRVGFGKRPEAALYRPEQEDPNLQPDKKGYYVYQGDRYKGGYAFKRFKQADVVIANEKLSVEETKKLALTNLPAPTAQNRLKFYKGDRVLVIKGGEQNLRGFVESVDGDLVNVKPQAADLQLPILAINYSHLKKAFENHDHCKVLEGTHKGASGFVVSVDNEREVLRIVTDEQKRDIEVLARHCQLSGDAATASSRLGEYDLNDLVQLDATRVGVIIRFEGGAVKLLDNEGRVVLVQPQSIQYKRNSRNAVCKDMNGQAISRDDLVNITDNPHRLKSGRVLHVFRNFVFVKSLEMKQHDTGIFVFRANECALPGGDKNTFVQPMAPEINRRADRLGGFHLQVGKNGLIGGVQSNRQDELIGQRVKIKRGEYKGYGGTVKGAKVEQVRVQLDCNNRVVQVPRADVAPWTNPPTSDERNSTSFIDTSRNLRGVPQTPSREPRTPMRDLTATPARYDAEDEDWGSTQQVSDSWEPAANSPVASPSPFRPAFPSFASPQSPLPSPSPFKADRRVDVVEKFPEAPSPSPSPLPQGSEWVLQYGSNATPAPPAPAPAPVAVSAPAATVDSSQPTQEEITSTQSSQAASFHLERLPPWCAKGLLVRVVDMGGQKGEVVDLLPFNRVLVRVKGGREINVQHTGLDRVIPEQNSKVRVLDGEFKGMEAILTTAEGEEAIINFVGGGDMQICMLSSVAPLAQQD